MKTHTSVVQAVTKTTPGKSIKLYDVPELLDTTYDACNIEVGEPIQRARVGNLIHIIGLACILCEASQRTLAEGGCPIFLRR